MKKGNVQFWKRSDMASVVALSMYRSLLSLREGWEGFLKSHQKLCFSTLHFFLLKISKELMNKMSQQQFSTIPDFCFVGWMGYIFQKISSGWKSVELFCTVARFVEKLFRKCSGKNLQKIYSKWKSIEFSYTVGRIFHEIVLNIFWIGFREKYHQDGKALNSHAKLARFCWEIVFKKIRKNLQKKTLNSFAGEAEILFQIPDCQLESGEGREFPFTFFNFSFLSFPFTFEKLKLF